MTIYTHKMSCDYHMITHLHEFIPLGSIVVVVDERLVLTEGLGTRTHDDCTLRACVCVCVCVCVHVCACEKACCEFGCKSVLALVGTI